MGQPLPWVGLSHSAPMQSALETYFSHVLTDLGGKRAQDLSKNDN